MRVTTRTGRVSRPHRTGATLISSPIIFVQALRTLLQHRVTLAASQHTLMHKAVRDHARGEEHTIQVITFMLKGSRLVTEHDTRKRTRASADTYRRKG